MQEGLVQWWAIMCLHKLPCYKVTTEISQLELDKDYLSPWGNGGSTFLPCTAVPLSMEQPSNSQEILQPMALILRSHSLVLLCPWGLSIFDKGCKTNIISWFHHPVVYAKTLKVCILIPTSECLGTVYVKVTQALGSLQAGKMKEWIKRERTTER